MADGMDGGWRWRSKQRVKDKDRRSHSRRFCSFTPTIMSNIGRQADIHLWKSLYTCMSSVSPSRIQGGRTMDRRMNREFPPPFLIFGCVLIVDLCWWWMMMINDHPSLTLATSHRHSNQWILSMLNMILCTTETPNIQSQPWSSELSGWFFLGISYCRRNVLYWYQLPGCQHEICPLEFCSAVQVTID